MGIAKSLIIELQKVVSFSHVGTLFSVAFLSLEEPITGRFADNPVRSTVLVKTYSMRIQEPIFFGNMAGGPSVAYGILHTFMLVPCCRKSPERVSSCHFTVCRVSPANILSSRQLACVRYARMRLQIFMDHETMKRHLSSST